MAPPSSYRPGQPKHRFGGPRRCPSWGGEGGMENLRGWEEKEEMKSGKEGQGWQM